MGLKDKGPKEMLGLVQEKATLVSMIFTFRVIIQKRSQMRAKMNIYLFWRAQNWNYLKNGTVKVLILKIRYLQIQDAKKCEHPLKFNFSSI